MSLILETNKCAKKATESSTVARYIRRFRNGRPLSPRRRQHNRALMVEEFWWTRSGVGDKTPENLDWGSSRANSPSSEDADERLYMCNRELKEIELEPVLGWRSVEKGLENEVHHQPPGDPPFSGRATPSQLTSYQQSDTETWTATEVPSSTHTVQHACRKPDTQSQELRRRRDASSPKTKDHDVPGDHSQTLDEQSDVFSDLDVRASAVLERCRHLLAGPSNASEHVGIVMESLLAAGGGGPEKLSDQRNVSFEQPFGDLEQRVWQLLNATSLSDLQAPLEVNYTQGTRAESVQLQPACIITHGRETMNGAATDGTGEQREGCEGLYAELASFESHRHARVDAQWRGAFAQESQHVLQAPSFPRSCFATMNGRTGIVLAEGQEDTRYQKDHAESIFYRDEDDENIINDPERSNSFFEPDVSIFSLSSDMLHQVEDSFASCRHSNTNGEVSVLQNSGSTRRFSSDPRGSVMENVLECDHLTAGDDDGLGLFWRHSYRVGDFGDDAVVKALVWRAEKIVMEISRRHSVRS